MVATVALAIAAFIAGHAYVQRSIEAGQQPQFYQENFGPAVSLACGHGYQAPAWRQISELDAFLSLTTRDFDCSRLSNSFDVTPLTTQQVTWRYLITAFGLLWQLTGVSWAVVPTVASVFFSLTIVSAYFLFRVCSNPLLALLGALYLLGSPLHLTHLVYVRDYAKAPFLIAGFGILVVIITRPMNRRQLWTISAVAGLVVGVGAGFRNDVLITMPAFVITVLAFAPNGWRDHGINRVGALAVGVVAFLVSAAPLFQSASGWSANMKDVALLGFAQTSTRQLGLSENVYSLGRQYNDSYVGAVVMDYAFRRQHIGAPLQAYDRTYNRASSEMFREFGGMFPADFIVRTYASAWLVLRLPASSAYEQQPPPYIGSESMLGRFFTRRKHIVARTIKVSVFPVVVAIGLLAYDSIRRGAGIACLIAYFAFYPAIQFWPRHYFHLNVIAVAAALFVVSRLALGWGSHRRINVARAVVVGLLLAATAVGMWLVLLAARRYQDKVVRRHIDMLVASEWQPVDLQTSLGFDGIRVARFARLPAEEEAHTLRGVVRSEYLRLSIVRQAGCSSDPLPVTVAYERPFTSLSHVLTFPAAHPNGGTTETLFAVYYASGSGDSDDHVRVDHLEIPDGGKCSVQLSRMTHAETSPLLLDVTLSPDWRQKPLHQMLVQW